MNVFTLFIAIASVVASVASGAAEKNCRTPIANRYVNADHGYSFLVPKGYGGQWQSPCNYDPATKDCMCIGNHGLYISLNKTAGINVFSSFAADLVDDAGNDPKPQIILASMVKFQEHSAKELRATSFRVEAATVLGNHGKRILMRWVDPDTKTPMTKVSYQLATRFYKSQRPSAELTVSLIAPDAEFDSWQPLFGEVLNSFKWLPDR